MSERNDATIKSRQNGTKSGLVSVTFELLQFNFDELLKKTEKVFSKLHDMLLDYARFMPVYLTLMFALKIYKGVRNFLNDANFSVNKCSIALLDLVIIMLLNKQ